jgi:hypothetical protein
VSLSLFEGQLNLCLCSDSIANSRWPAYFRQQHSYLIFTNSSFSRNCGLVYCNRCSGHSLPLPQFGMDRPVRICNRCNLLYQYPEDLVSPVGPVGSASSRFSSGATDSSSSSRRRRRTPVATSRSVPNLAAATPAEEVVDSPSGGQRRQAPQSRANWTRNFGMVS